MRSRGVTQKSFRNYLRVATALIVLVVFLFPFLWMINISLKPEASVFDLSEVLSLKFTLKAYVDVFTGTELVRTFINSIVIAGSTTLLALAFSAPAAYAFAKSSKGYAKNISFWILTLRMAPPIGVVIPFYLLARSLRLLDTHFILIVLYLSFNLPFSIWMLTGFFKGIPGEIEEAALIDGCGRWGVFVRICLPYITPGLVACGVIALIFAWNEFLFAMILTDITAKTLPVTIASFLLYYGTQWGRLCAAGTVVAVPILIIALVFQRRIVYGFSMGALK